MNHNFDISIDKLMQTLSEILSDKYDCKITLTAVRKAPDAGRAAEAEAAATV